MSGLLLLFVAGIWLAIVLWLSAFVLRRLVDKTWRCLAGIGVFLVLLPMPLIDEIIGKRQFEKLCKENSEIHVDRAKAAGKKVYLHSIPEVWIQGTAVPIWLHQWRFVDETTVEPVVSYNTLRASGGRLIQALGISGGDAPLTFAGSCAPNVRPYSVETFRKLGITYIEPPIEINGEAK